MTYKKLKYIAVLVLVAFTVTFGLPTQQLAYANSIENIKQTKANIKYDKPATSTTLGSFVDSMLAIIDEMKISLDQEDLRDLRHKVKEAIKTIWEIKKTIQKELDQNEKTLNRLNAGNAKKKHDAFKSRVEVQLKDFEGMVGKLDELATLANEFKGNDREALKNQLEEIERVLSPEQPQQPLGTLPHNIANITPPEPAIGSGTDALFSGNNRAQEELTLPQPPVEADLEETPETILTQDIKELADNLKTPVAIYEYIRNNINFEPYYGSRKGAVGTLNQRGGNDYDQASLLIAMLRYKNIPARYVRGTVEVPIEKVQGWTGTETPEASVKVLGSLGIPTASMVSGGKIVAARLEHIWVEVYVPYENYRGIGDMRGKEVWIPLDPSFKQYSVEEGLDIKTIAGIENDEIVEAFQSETDSSIYSDSLTNVNIDKMSGFVDDATQIVEQYVENNNLENADIKQLIGGKTIVPENLGLLPLTLPYKTVAVLSKTSDIPDDYSEKIGFSIRGDDPFNLNFYGGDDFNVKFRGVELYGKRITISWVPATQEDEDIINTYGGIFKTPAYMVQLKPQMKADGQVIAEGKAAGMGNRQEFTISMGHVGRPVEEVTNPVTVGGLYSISFNFGKIDVQELNQIKERIMEIKDTATEDTIYTDEVLGEVLNSVGKAYFGQLDAMNSIVANTYNVSSVRQVSEVMTGYRPKVKYLFNTPVEMTGGSFFIDVDHDVFGVVSLDGEKEKEIAYMMNTGVLGSSMEHGIHEQIFQIPSVSSIKILTEASNRGIPIYTIGKHNMDRLDEVFVSSSVKTDIRNAVNCGKIVTIPQREINYYDWQGAGYIVMDPETGAAGYMISGGLSGGSAAIDGAVTLVGLFALAWAIYDTVTIAAAFIAATNPIIMVVFFTFYVISLINVIMTLENILMYWQTGDFEYASKLMGDLIMNIAFMGVFKVIDWILPGIMSLFKGVKNHMDDVARAADNLGDDIVEDIARMNGPDRLPDAENLFNKLTDMGIEDDLIKKVADDQGLDGLNSLENLMDSGKVTKEQLADLVDEGLDLNRVTRFLDDGLSLDSASKLTQAAEDGIITPDVWNGKFISETGDATHLTNRELSEINRILKEGRDVDVDVIKALKDQAENLADSYGSKISSLSDDALANLSKDYAPSTQPSKILSDELENAGIIRPADCECHHIVPVNQAGQDIVDILSANGININSAANGVFLPRNADALWPGQITHSAFSNFTDAGNSMFRHGQVYIDYISDNIRQINNSGLGKPGLLDFLEETRRQLMNGEIDFLYMD